MYILACGQDFHMLVANPRKQKLYIEVKDSFGFTDFTIGGGEVKYCSVEWLIHAEVVN